jgi:hypothetical protein
MNVIQDNAELLAENVRLLQQIQDEILKRKQELVLILQRKLCLFKKHLKKEEHLTRGVPPISVGSLGAGHVEGGELSIEVNQGSIPQRSRASLARRTYSRQDKSDDSFEDAAPSSLPSMESSIP